MTLTDIGQIKSLFNKYGFSFTKSLGQNFLINPTVCPRIAEKSGITPDSGVIEIGTGIGVLTCELAKRAKKVVALEIDHTLQPILKETLAEYDNVEVIFADVMQTDLKQLIADKFPGMETSVCANLPYYITSPVIMKLLEERLPIRSVTVMVQLEAAQRICAAPGTRNSSALTIAVNYYSSPKKLFNVSPGSFMPAPKVDSAVIRLEPHETPLYDVDDEKLFFSCVRQAFSQRRKQLINPVAGYFGINKEILSDLMSESGLKPTARAEELTMDNFVTLYRIVEQLKK